MSARGLRHGHAAGMIVALGAIGGGVAACSQILGLPDDLEVADGAAGVDAASVEAAVDAPEEPAADDAVATDASDGSVLDGGGAIAQCTAQTQGVCLVTEVPAPGVALLAAASGSVYLTQAGTPGLLRFDPNGAPLGYVAGSGVSIGSLATFGAHVAFGGPAGTTVGVTITDPTGANSTQTQGHKVTAVALSPTYVGWITGAAAETVEINPLGVENAVGSSVVALVGNVDGFVTLGAGNAVRFVGQDGSDAAVQSLGAAGPALLSSDPAGAIFVALVGSDSTSFVSVSRSAHAVFHDAGASARGLVVAPSSLVVVFDGKDGGAPAYAGAISRTNQQESVLHLANGAAVGPIAYDGSVFVYWVETDLGTRRSRVYRWSP